MREIFVVPEHILIVVVVIQIYTCDKMSLNDPQAYKINECMQKSVKYELRSVI